MAHTATALSCASGPEARTQTARFRGWLCFSSQLCNRVQKGRLSLDTHPPGAHTLTLTHRTQAERKATVQGGDREEARQRCSLWLGQTLSRAVGVCLSRGLWTQHPGWPPRFLFLPIAVPLGFPEQIVAQPQRTPSKASADGRAAAPTLGWKVTGPLQAPAALCPSESSPQTTP